MFAKAGSIIPKRNMKQSPTLGAAEMVYNELRLDIIPGSLTGQTTIYEDDGKTVAYLDGYSTTISASYIRDDSSLKLTLSAVVNKKWHTSAIKRNLLIKVLNCYPPTLVGYERKGKLPTYIQYSLEETTGKAFWTYNPHDISVDVYIPEMELEGDSYTVFLNGDFK